MSEQHSDPWRHRLELVREIDQFRRELAEANRQLAEARKALKPFSHPDLSEKLGGQMQDDSIVFGRNKAVLRIRDFQRAKELLEESE